MLFSVTVKCSLIIIVTVTLKCSVLFMVSVTLQCSVLHIVSVTMKCSVLLMVTHLEVFSVPYGHSHHALCIAPYGYCHSQVFSAPCGHSLCSVHCTLWSLPLCSLPPLCSGNERPRSTYSLTSKQCSSQSLLPFQHSAVHKILQSMSTAIKPQPSLHHRCCSLGPKLSQNFHSHSITFTGTSADLSTHV